MISKTVHVNSGKRSRIAVLSALALMGLFLSTGTTLAAEDFKLWRMTKPDEKPVIVKGFDKSEAKEKLASPVKQLTSNKPDELKSFAESFAKEPVQFAQAIKGALLKTDSSKLADFKKSLSEAFSALIEKDGKEIFGSKFRADAHKELLARILGLSADELKDEEWLKTLFDDPTLLVLLGLRDTDPSKEKEVLTPPPSDDASKKLEELKKQMEEQQRRSEAAQSQLQQTIAQLSRSQQTLTPPVTPSPVVGEQVTDSAADQRVAQQICDLVNARANNGDDRRINELKDAFNALANQINQAPPPQLAQNNRRNDNFDKLANLFDQVQNGDRRRDNQVQQFPQNQFPFAPQTARREEPKNSFLDQPLVNPTPPEQQPVLPPAQFPQAGSTAATNTLQRPDVPSGSAARTALNNARNVLTTAKNRPSVQNQVMQAQQMAQFNPMGALSPLVTAKVQAEENTKRVNMALQQVNDQAARLDEQLEELKDATTSADTKRREAAAASELENVKRQYEQFKQMAQGNQDPQAAQAIQYQAMQLAEEVNRKETALNSIRTESQIVDEETKRKLKSLAKLRDQLNAEKSNLEGELSTLKTEETTATQALNNTEMQIRQGYQQQQMPPGTPNVNRLQQAGGQRSTPPRRLGQAGAMNALPDGATQRGTLAK